MNAIAPPPSVFSGGGAIVVLGSKAGPLATKHKGKTAETSHWRGFRKKILPALVSFIHCGSE
jgi:hypothetical protein